MQMKLLASIIVLITIGLFHIHKNNERPFSTHLHDVVQEVNSQNLSWKATSYSHWQNFTFEDAKSLAGLLEVNSSPINLPRKEFTQNSLSAEEIPETFDSRIAWPKCESLFEIRDQTKCGACWAFATTSAMSDRICIHSNQKLQTRVSAEDLIECCTICGKGCGGGGIYEPWQTWVADGIVSGGLNGDTHTCKPFVYPPCQWPFVELKKYPLCPQGQYETPKCQRKCQDGSGIEYQKDKSFGESAYILNGEEDMKLEIVKNGPISGGMYLYSDLITYKKGVYHHVAGRQIGGHVVKIIGFGEENGEKYWLVANSWNETWGDQGYFKIKRGTNECSIEEHAVGGLPFLKEQ